MWSLEFAADAERDFELIFDHLVKSYLEFSEDNDVAFERAVERIRGIRISANKLALAPKQGTLRPDILESLRFVRLDKAVFWFVLDEGQKIVRVLAVFFGAQDHIRHMLVRLLDQQDSAVAQISQAKGQRGDHRQNVLGQHRFLLHGWSRMFAFDPCQNGGDVAILAIEGNAALLVMPGEARETPLDRANRQGRGPIVW